MTFRQAIEREVRAGNTLAGAYLEQAPLGGNWYGKGADLGSVDLRGAILRGARLSYGSLRNGNLAFADLEGAYLSDVDIRGANFASCKLFDAKFRNNVFDGVSGLAKTNFRSTQDRLPKYRMLEKYPDQAESVYRSLMSYFSGLGALDDASWAAYRYRVMHHDVLRSRLSFVKCFVESWIISIWADGHADVRRVKRIALVNWLANTLEYFASWFYRWVAGYGEKPLRVAGASAIVVLMYAAGYAVTGALSEGGFRAAFYFSLVTFTTLGYGDVLPKVGFRLMAASEAVLGLLLVGLFLFTLSRRAVGRA